MTPEEQYEIGYAYRCEGNYALAKDAFHKVLAETPGHVKSRWQLALILGFEGDFDGSLAALKELSQQSPNSTDIRYDHAMTLMMLGFMDEACAEFREVVRIDPDHEKAHQQLAYCT